MTPTPIAIDFGSTRTKVSYWNEEENEPMLAEIGRDHLHIIPSVFYIPRLPDTQISVGDAALDHLADDPEGIVIGVKKEIHKIGKMRLSHERSTPHPTDLIQEMLRYIRQFFADHVFSDAPDTCTLTIPVSFELRQRKLLQQAALDAGFTTVHLVEEPVAAAMSWLTHNAQKMTDIHSKHVIICDVGGGTTDLALLSYQNGVFQAHPEVDTVGFDQGGNDIDANIWQRIYQEQAQDKLELHNLQGAFCNQIRKVKELLLSDFRNNIPLSVGGKEITVERNIVTEESEHLVQVVVQETQDFANKCTHYCGEKNIPVLLVGGGARTPGLQEKLELGMSCPILRWNYSDYATVLGALHHEAPTEDLKPQASTVARAGATKTSSRNHKRNSALIFVSSIAIVVALTFSTYQLWRSQFWKKQENAPVTQTPTPTNPIATPQSSEASASPSTSTPVVNTPAATPATQPQPNAEDIDLIVKQAVEEAIGDTLPQALAGIQKNIDNSRQESIPKPPTREKTESMRKQEEALRAQEERAQQLKKKLARIEEQSQQREEQDKQLEAQAEAARQAAALARQKSQSLVNEEPIPQPKPNPINALQQAIVSGERLPIPTQPIPPRPLISDQSALYQEGTNAQQSRNHNKAASLFRQGAEEGDVYCMHQLGMAYVNGRGVPRDFQQALSWFEQAAQENFVQSQLYLGFIYEYGFGVTQNIQTAKMWYQKAAKQGDPNAQQYLKELNASGS